MGNKDSKQSKGPTKSKEDELFDQLFEFKQQSNEFKRSSERSKKEELIAKQKVKKAIEENNPEAARMYADEAIRCKNQVSQYMNFSYKMQAVSARLESAYKKQILSDKMIDLTNKMSEAMKSTNLIQMVDSMRQFEKVFDDLEIKTNVMSDTLNNVAGSTAKDQMDVDNLINQVAKENNMKTNDEWDLQIPQNNPQMNKQTNSQVKQSNQALHN